MPALQLPVLTRRTSTAALPQLRSEQVMWCPVAAARLSLAFAPAVADSAFSVPRSPETLWWRVSAVQPTRACGQDPLLCGRPIPAPPCRVQVRRYARVRRRVRLATAHWRRAPSQREGHHFQGASAWVLKHRHVAPKFAMIVYGASLQLPDVNPCLRWLAWYEVAVAKVPVQFLAWRARGRMTMIK